MVLPGNLLSGVFESKSIDLFYNLADAINKIGFGLVIYSVATAETAKARKAVA
jgi:sensory rhodopsin